MARGLNKVQIIGRLGRDPEMRYTEQGSAVTNFSVATGGKWTDRNGNERDDTEWFRVVAWDKLAETCNQYLTKGKEVYIEGRLKTRRYTDRDGLERTVVEVVANDMVMLGSKSDSGRRDYPDDDRGYDDSQDDEAPPQRSARPAPGRAAGGRNQPQPIGDETGEDDIPF
jgi:single-strand DNA-binding protein